MSPRSRQSGLAIVEFALCVPVLLAIMLATAEIVRAFNQYSTLAHAVRQSARYLAGRALLGTTGVVTVSGQLATEARNLVVYGSTGGTGAARLPGLAVGQVSVTDAGAGNISVSVAYPYQSLLGGSISMFGLGSDISTSFNMTVTNTMRAL
jgi:Flp pilus assembly protein TadG